MRFVIRAITFVLFLLVVSFLAPGEVIAQSLPACPFRTVPASVELGQPFRLEIDTNRNGQDYTFGGTINQFGVQSNVPGRNGHFMMNYNSSTGVASLDFPAVTSSGNAQFRLYDGTQLCDIISCNYMCGFANIYIGTVTSDACSSIRITTPNGNIPNIGEDINISINTNSLPPGSNYNFIIDQGGSVTSGNILLGNFSADQGVVTVTYTGRFEAGSTHTVGVKPAGVIGSGSVCTPTSFTVTGTPQQGEVEGGGAAGNDDSPAFELCRQATTPEEKAACETCVGGTTITDPTTQAYWTAFGCIKATSEGIVQSFLRIGMGLAGGFVLLSILYGAFLLTTSSGDPKRVQEGQEMISSAVMGLLFVIFSIIILQFIGVSILRIPGFGT